MKRQGTFCWNKKLYGTLAAHEMPVTLQIWALFKVSEKDHTYVNKYVKKYNKNLLVSNVTSFGGYSTHAGASGYNWWIVASKLKKEKNV